MDPSDQILAEALVHDANVKLLGAQEGDVGLNHELDNIRKVLLLAEKVLAGKATGEDKTSVGDLVHLQVRGLYNL